MIIGDIDVCGFMLEMVWGCFIFGSEVYGWVFWDEICFNLD